MVWGTPKWHPALRTPLLQYACSSGFEIPWSLEAPDSGLCCHCWLAGPPGESPQPSTPPPATLLQDPLAYGVSAGDAGGVSLGPWFQGGYVAVPRPELHVCVSHGP